MEQTRKGATGSCTCSSLQHYVLTKNKLALCSCTYITFQSSWCKGLLCLETIPYSWCRFILCFIIIWLISLKWHQFEIGVIVLYDLVTFFLSPKRYFIRTARGLVWSIICSISGWACHNVSFNSNYSTISITTFYEKSTRHESIA